jgi:hypothetical protein
MRATCTSIHTKAQEQHREVEIEKPKDPIKTPQWGKRKLKGAKLLLVLP